MACVVRSATSARGTGGDLYYRFHHFIIFIILNTKFIILNTKFIILNAKVQRNPRHTFT